MEPPADGSLSVFPSAEVVVEVLGEQLTYGDLALVAMAVGWWAPFVRTSARAAEAAERQPVDEARVRDRSIAFRRAHRLEAAEDLRSWLDARAIDRPAWQAAMARQCLGEDAGGDHVDVPAKALRSVLAVDAFCGDLWARCAAQACRWVAAAHLGEGPPVERAPPPELVAEAGRWGLAEERLAEVVGWQRAYQDLETVLSATADVAAAVAEHELDWTWFAFDELVLDAEAAAREALLCANEDHHDLADIGRRAGRSPASQRARADSLGPALHAAVLGAPLEVAQGPIEGPDGWSVVWVHERRLPSGTDPDVRASVVEERLDDAVERQLAGNVRWRGPT